MSALRQWLAPVLLGGLIVGGFVGLFVAYVRVKPPHPNVAKAPVVKPALTMAPEAETDDLVKLEPLFLPTPYNTSVLRLPPQARQEPGSMSFTYPPKLTVSESEGGIPLPEVVEVPKTPVQGLTVGEAPNPWPEVRRADVELPEFARRAAAIEVSQARSGTTVYAADLPISPETSALPADWAPMEFLVAIDPAGLVGAPVVSRPGNSEVVESFFRKFLANSFHLGARLPPGFYTVRIGP